MNNLRQLANVILNKVIASQRTCTRRGRTESQVDPGIELASTGTSVLARLLCCLFTSDYILRLPLFLFHQIALNRRANQKGYTLYMCTLKAFNKNDAEH